MAMVGGPKVILMDEPSTGMDPRSKRFLWDTILASFQVTAPYKLNLFFLILSNTLFNISGYISYKLYEKKYKTNTNKWRRMNNKIITR